MMMMRKRSTLDPLPQNARDPNWLDALWSSLPTTAGRHGARLITRAQFDDLGARVTMDLKVDASEARKLVDEALSGIEATGPAGPHKDVIRFITHPDFRVTHPDMVGDMTVEDTRALAGDIDCFCVAKEEARWFPLSQLWPAGAASDMVREVTVMLMRAVTEDMVAQLIDAGALKKPDPAALPAIPAGQFARSPGSMALDPDPVLTAGRGEQLVEHAQSETAHHLGVHPEYAIDPKSASTNPGKWQTGFIPPLPLDGQ